MTTKRKLSFKKKTIKVTPYQCKLTMILAEDLNVIRDTYNLTANLDGFGAVTFKNPNKDRHYVVVFSDPKHTSNIVHEIIHIRSFIYLDIHEQVNFQNDEHEAYLCGWLFEQIEEFLNKNK